MVRCFPCTPEIWPKEYVRQFDQNFAVSVIYCFYLHTPIREKHIVLFHLIFLLYMNIQPKFRFLINFFFYSHATIPPKYRFLFHLFFLLCTTFHGCSSHSVYGTFSWRMRSSFAFFSNYEVKINFHSLKNPWFYYRNIWEYIMRLFLLNVWPLRLSIHINIRCQLAKNRKNNIYKNSNKIAILGILW